jgi:hypothetical protein
MNMVIVLFFRNKGIRRRFYLNLALIRELRTMSLCYKEEVVWEHFISLSMIL